MQLIGKPSVVAFTCKKNPLDDLFGLCCNLW